MIRAVLSIGSNLEDRYRLLATVAEDFSQEIVGRSGIYATPPWGVTDQGEFLNAILIVETEHSPRELLTRGQALENVAHRVRERRWGPRTLDVDIVQVIDLDTREEIISPDPVLTLPHPHAHERGFVLLPWLEADPQARLKGTPVVELVSTVDTTGITRVRGWEP